MTSNNNFPTKSAFILFALICFLMSQGCSDDVPVPEKHGPKSVSLGYLKAPAGFQVTVFAENVPNARQLAKSPSGIIYAGSRRAGKVYAIVDSDNDFKADTVYTIADGLRLPSGIAYKDGDLYVAAVSEIWRFDDIDEQLSSPPAPVLITDDYPTEGHHGWKYLGFGPDGKLYVPVGAPCNVCNYEEENPIFSTITRINPDGTGREIVARGVRNSVGFTWHPKTKNLWFTDNGRDWLGDDTPSCELNELTEEGQHFGFPFLHGNDVWDPEYGEEGKKRSEEFIRPVVELGPHVAPLGMIFYTGDMFPTAYKNTALIALHGSWNRSEKIGYEIVQVRFDEAGNVTRYEPFITGWLGENEEVRGRPVSILQLNDGSILISDDQSGKIYRVTYSG